MYDTYGQTNICTHINVGIVWPRAKQILLSSNTTPKMYDTLDPLMYDTSRNSRTTTLIGTGDNPQKATFFPIFLHIFPQCGFWYM